METMKDKKQMWNRIRMALIAVLVLALVINPLLTYAPFAIGAEGGEEATQATPATVRFDTGGASVEIDGQAPEGGELSVPAGADLAMRVTAPEGFDVAAVTATAPDGTVSVAHERDGLYVVEGAAVADGLAVRVDTVETAPAAVAEGDGLVVAEDPAAADADATTDGDDDAAENPTDYDMDAVVDDDAPNGDAVDDNDADETGDEVALFDLGAQEGSGSGTMLRAPAPENLFTVNAAGVITAFDYNSGDPVTNLEIPGTVNGTTVTGIGANVFAGCQLKTVVIPETVTSIGANAFWNNPSLTSVTFAGNSQLQTVGSSAFSGARLVSVAIPATVTDIGSSAFYGNTNLTSVTFSAGSQLQTVGGSSFQGCSALPSITLPDSVTSIGVAAFYSCTSLTGFVVPSGVTELKSDTFYGCTSLASVTLHDGFTTLGSGVFGRASSLKNIALPDSLTTIGPSAFNRTALTEITIPADVTAIGNDAFGVIANGQNLIIRLPHHYPNAITGKPWGAGTRYIYWKSDVASCFDITPEGVIVGMKPPEHDDGACGHPDWHKTNKGDIVIPNTIGGITVKALLPGAFQNNGDIRSISFEAGTAITEIPDYAFCNMSYLTSVALPEGIESIGEAAFQSTIALTSIALPQNLVNIGANAFNGSRLATVTIPGAVTNIGAQAFVSNYLKTATIEGSGALTMASNAFSAGETIETISIPGRSFNTQVNGSDNSAGEKQSGQPWGAQYADVVWANKTYDAEVIITSDGWHYNRVTGQLVKYAGSTGTGVDVVVPYVIPYNGTDYTVKSTGALFSGKTFRKVTIAEGYNKEIGSQFMRDATVTEVVLPESLTVFPDRLLWGAKGLQKVNLPAGLTNIGRDAFSGCTTLTQIDGFLPAGVKAIEGNAFNSVPLNLLDWEIPSGITSIGGGAFNNSGLTGTLSIPANVTSISTDSFGNNPGLTEIQVDMYRSTAPVAMKNGQPWGAVNARVYYKGEKPVSTHVEKADGDLTNSPLTQVDFSTAVGVDTKGKPVTSIYGLWICEGDLSGLDAAEIGALFTDTEENDLVQIFDNQTDSAVYKANVPMALPALSGGTYTVFVATAMMTKSQGQSMDPTQYVPYTFTVAKDGPVLAPTASHVTYTAAKFQVMCATMSDEELVAAVLGAASPFAEDPWSGENVDFFVASDVEAAASALRALVKADDACEVSLDARYDGSFTCTDTQLKTPFGATFGYTATGSTKFTVTLVPGYTVAFEEGDHGSFPADAVTSFPGLEDGDTMPTAPAVAADTGWEFAGWKDTIGNTFYDDSNPLPEKVSGSMTLVAQYSQLTYTLSFDLNGGTGTASAQNLHFGDKATAPANPAKTGYDFAGWAYNGVLWDFEESTMPADDITLVAQWEPSKGTQYKVEHYPQSTDGTWPSAPAKTTGHKGTTGSTVDATAEFFANQYVDTGNGKAALSGTVAADGSLVLKVYYARYTYNVVYSGGGLEGTAPQGAANQLVGTSVRVQGSGTLAKKDCEFAGWALSANAESAAFKEGDTLDPLAAGLIAGEPAASAPHYTVTLYPVWKNVARTLVIKASDFRMSLADAQAHQAMASPQDRFKDLIARGDAKATWKETGEPVNIKYLEVVPSQGDGKSIDAIVGDYQVTYYASADNQDVEIMVTCVVYGTMGQKGSIAGSDFSYDIAGGALTEDQVRSLGGVTVYDADGKPTGEPGNINPDDLAALNAAIAAGQTGPVKVRFTNHDGDEVTITVTLTAPPLAPTPQNGGGTTTPAVYTPVPAIPAPTNPIEAAVIPVVQAMRDIAVSVIPDAPTPAAQQISDDGTPLASEHGWCWVHYYIGLFMLLTLVYTAAVAIRRRAFIGDLRQLEGRVLGTRESLNGRAAPQARISEQ